MPSRKNKFITNPHTRICHTVNDYPSDAMRGDCQRRLPLGDVLNVLVVTDTHGWVGGHRHESLQSTAPGPVLLDATFGDILSFHTHLTQQARGVPPPILAMNGDINDGTGLSRVPPVDLLDIIKKMPFGALTVGNHMLYRNENIQYLRRSFVPYWNGSYVTSNVELVADRQPLGSRYFLANNDTVLVLAFLYQMRDHDSLVSVVPIAEALNSSWFAKATGLPGLRAALLLCHADAEEPMIRFIVSAIRQIRRDDLPILVLAGHSHLRKYVRIDARAVAIEAGRYTDTVGFVSYDSIHGFEHVFIDGSVSALQRVACAEQFETKEGVALTNDIRAASARLGLSTVVGCSSDTYFARTGQPSLRKLYLDEVVPNELFESDDTKRLIMHHSSFRSDLHAGNVLADDLYSISPFQDSFFQVATNVKGSVVSQLVNDLYQDRDGYFVKTLEPDRTYDVFAIRFEVDDIVRAFSKRTDLMTPATKIPAFPGKNVTGLWFDYLRHSSHNCAAPPPTIAPPGDALKYASRTLLFGLIALFAITVSRRWPYKRRCAADSSNVALPTCATVGFSVVDTPLLTREPIKGAKQPPAPNLDAADIGPMWETEEDPLPHSE